MRRVAVLTVLIALLVLAGCGGTSSSHSSPASGDLPPVWVQREAMWQSLAAGEPQPRACQWLLTTPARAARLAGSTTSYVGRAWSGEVYVVVLRGRFTTDQRATGSSTISSTTLYLMLATEGHTYLAHGFASAGLDLAALGRLHTYVPQLPVRRGVWGHTMVEGGKFPGGPWPLAHVEVAVWKGDRVLASGQPLMRLHSDGDGFFSLDLAPGIYTLRLGVSNQGWPVPVTVTVKAGRPVAAGIYGERI